MKVRTILAGLLCASAVLGGVGLLSSCGGSESAAAKVLAERRAANPGVDFSVFDREDLTPEQREYLTFLYAYMALPDITDHDGQYFLDNVNTALRAREEMPWGKDVPDREFRHFVVPVRVNNEPLDGHRMQFYEELRDRVKDLTVEEAILEVNHWCHEKATYQPSDGRTRSPLQTCGAAIGRCGEESTFTVAALRSVGIPARQVYTPRWAHTDDNHAWVEAYANGKWHFIGACEPEPVLDLGWFNAPASRGMLMNTRVLGPYDGPEEKLQVTPDYTDINVTSNYAPTTTVSVSVVGPDGQPVDSANVDFRLYNYAEFYPLTSRTFRASDGKPVTFSSGRGDLLIWASDGERYGFAPYTVGEEPGTAVITLDRTSHAGTVSEFTLTPPPGANNLPLVTPEQAAENDRRKAVEDSIRAAYCHSAFVPEGYAATLAKSTGLDRGRLDQVLTDARSNWQAVASLIENALDRGRALAMVESLSLKDRGDAPGAFLVSELQYAPDGNGSALYNEYVLCPRVGSEQLAANKETILNYFSADDAARFAADPAAWEKWVADNIEIVPSWYPPLVTISTEGVLRTGKANEASRNVFFVNGARSFGIPARIDQVSGKTQWADASGNWIDARFGEAAADGSRVTPSGKLDLRFTPVGRIDDPKYYAQFSLSKIVDGRPELLGYDDFAPWSTTFATPQTLDTGEYMLTTGQRMADGSVMTRVTFFDIREGETTPVDLVVRQDSTGVQVIGSFDAETRYVAEGETDPRSVLSTTGRGFYVLGVLSPRSEPSVHALNDIAPLAAEFDKAGLPLVLLTSGDTGLLRKAMADAGTMPERTYVGTDPDGAIAARLIEDLKLQPQSLPIFIIADTFNRVVYVQQGYTIGLGDKLLDVMHKL